MKHTLLKAGISAMTLIPSMLSAQEGIDVIPASPKLTIGANIGISRSNAFRYPISGESDLSAGVFGRYFLSEHWALQGGVNYSRGNEHAIDNYVKNNAVYNLSWRQLAVDVPLQLQYHFLSSQSKVRPYFGAGAVYTHFMNHSRSEMTQGSNKEVKSSVHTSDDFKVQLSQGVTWKLNDKWELNQSVHYRFDRHVGNMGFNIGLGYRFK